TAKTSVASLYMKTITVFLLATFVSLAHSQTDSPKGESKQPTLKETSDEKQDIKIIKTLDGDAAGKTDKGDKGKKGDDGLPPGLLGGKGKSADPDKGMANVLNKQMDQQLENYMHQFTSQVNKETTGGKGSGAGMAADSWGETTDAKPS